jgi:hypothetical protein
MSEREHNIRGIHHEISKPRKSPYDGYYYQRVRQVDDRGNLVGTGEQTHKSASPDSSDGLVEPSVDLLKLGKAIEHLLKMAGGTRGIATGGAGLAYDLYSGLGEGYKSWPGTDAPWERPFDWRTGSTPVDFVRGRNGRGIGDRNGIGSWWDTSADFPRHRPGFDWESEAQGFENVPVPTHSPPVRSPAWNDPFVRDSAAAAGIPGRNNVFEYGLPEPGSVQPPLMAPGATRGAGYIGAAVAPPIPFIPAVPDSAPGGIPGLMIEAGQTDPLNPNAPPPGGLAGLIQEYLRNNHRDSN